MARARELDEHQICPLDSFTPPTSIWIARSRASGQRLRKMSRRRCTRPLSTPTTTSSTSAFPNVWMPCWWPGTFTMVRTAACVPSARSSKVCRGWIPPEYDPSFATGTMTRWTAGRHGCRTPTVATGSALTSRRRPSSPTSRSVPWSMASAILPGMCTRTWCRVSGRWTRARSPSVSCTPMWAATLTTRPIPPAHWTIWRERGSTTGRWAMFTPAKSYETKLRRWCTPATLKVGIPTKPEPGASTWWKLTTAET